MDLSFEGSKTVKIDAKSRVALLASFRGALNPNHGNAVVINIAAEGCLVVYRPSEWELRQKSMLQLARERPGNRKARRYVRLLMGSKETVILDVQGRALLPEYLREYAGLTNEAKIIGVVDRLEIWDPGRFREHLQDASLGTLDELEAEFEYGPPPPTDSPAHAAEGSG